MLPLILIFIFVVLIIALIASTLQIVPQASAWIVERLGKYHATWDAGIHFKVPVIDKVVKKVSLKEAVMDFEPSSMITKDNVGMQIDSVVYTKVVDPKLFTYGVQNPTIALENLTATTLRSIIGEMTLDETLSNREKINEQMKMVVDEKTDPWGIKVTNVAIKTLNMHKDLQEAMEKQMKAERERRESILKAEGEKNSAILIAQGKKEAMVLEAEAERDAAIARAEGEAQALLKVYEAQAKGIELINQAKPSESYLKLQGLDALVKVADGQATKLIIPSDVQNLVSKVAEIKEAL